MEDVVSSNFDCQGTYRIGSQDISCYGGEAHGHVDLTKAMVVSCNGSFADIGTKLGNEKLLKTAGPSDLTRSLYSLI